MKLLRSTFLAFYLTSNNNNVSAFSSQLSTKSLSSRTTVSTTPTKLYMSIESLHETPKMQLSEEEILKESMFLQVVREVNMAKEYMDYLIEESGPTAAGDNGEVAKEEESPAAASSDDIELFGGGGDLPSQPTEAAPIIYNPSLRTDLGSTILLSGTTDSNLLSILNNNFFGQDLVPNFNFEQIKCLVNDVKQTKKSAISREARYGGLLDKLVIEEASNSKSALPTKEELEGVTSWIVQLTLGDTTKDELETIATLAKESTVKNVVVLIDGMASTKNVVGGWDSVVEASSNNFSCTLLAVGELYDGGKDGGYYHIGSLDTVDSISADTIDAPKLSKKKAYQLLAHALSLDSTVNQALTAFEYPVVALEAVTVPYAEGEFVKRDDEGNEKDDEYKNVKMEGRMIQAMREMGFTPVNELDVLVGKGIESFKEYIANPPNKKNAFTPATKTVQDEADEKILAQIEADIAERKAIQEVQDAEQKKIDIEGIAKEWVTREYTLRMLAGDIEDSVSEKDFMISVWDEALKEGAKAYEYIRSDEFAKQKKEKKAVANVEDKLFWDGMPDDMRKMREKMIEKVKQQYMDLLSEEELERIILSES